MKDGTFSICLAHATGVAFTTVETVVNLILHNMGPLCHSVYLESSFAINPTPFPRNQRSRERPDCPPRASRACQRSSAIPRYLQLRQEMESAEKLRASKTGLEMTNEKLEAELEETKRRLQPALATPAPTSVGTDGRKSSVLAR